MNTLIGVEPADLLIHGPSKLLVDAFHFHLPDRLIVGSYTPTGADVHDHFGVFRGIDQIESFGQTLGAASVFLECTKQGISPSEFKKRFTPTFLSLGNVNFHRYLKEGDTFVNLARITFHKFRQTTGSGKIYKVPDKRDLSTYFSQHTIAETLEQDLDTTFELIAEINAISGRTMRNDLLNLNTL